MIKPIKICQHHGALFIEDVIRQGLSKAGLPRLRCKKCMSEVHKANYEKNKEKLRKKHTEYRKNNREKVRQIHRESYQKNKHKRMSEVTRHNALLKQTYDEVLEKRKNYNADQTYLMSETYIKRTLYRDSILTHKEIPVELVEAKKAILKLKRRIRSQINKEIVNYMGKQNVKDK